MIIIGAGIAGLATGCYAQMNGYRTRTFELHDKPGGLCTSWHRQGYTFDGCIHHLAGAGPDSRIFPIWEELGAVQGREMSFADELVRVETPDGKAFHVYVDPDELEAHMKALAPADGRVIDSYVGALRRFSGVELLAAPLFGPAALLRLLPRVPALIRWGRATLSSVAERFRDPFLRQAFPTIQYDFPNIPALINLNFLAGCHRQILGWPLGGSLAFSQAIADRYAGLGGELHYRSRVEHILVENDRAVGVHLADGAEHRADVVISAADGRTTIFDMLGGRYTNEAIRAYYAEPDEYQEMSVHVSLGVARDLSEDPRALVLFLENPVTLMGELHDRLDVENYGFDPSMAPPGKAVLKVMLGSRYSFWKALSVDRVRYREEKAAIAETIIEHLDARFPGLKQQVEVVDVATPLTIERYTGNMHGFQAWGPKKNPLGTMIKGLSKTLPGLENFHMVGQWAGATIGISTAAIMARGLVKTLCKQEGREFTTSVPE
jgi:phytoene dehydrogenase-like protein